jgi:ubiquinone/menaquinone biosynthesis C-methylase UbiE
MPKDPRMLTHQQAITFYNHFGAKQDWQSFETAQAVFEFGCGTGAFADLVLAHHLPQGARYLALDSSATMVRLARARLARFGARVVVRQTDSSLQFAEGAGSFDRVVSTYVLDLLAVPDIAQLLAEAHRLLTGGGRLCLVSLTPGSTRLSRLVTRAWTRIHALSPRLVGGCRPLELRDYLPGTGFRIDYVRVVTRFGVPSEVVVASRTSERRLLSG